MAASNQPGASWQNHPKNRIREAAATAAGMAQQVASSVGHQADDATYAVGSGLKSLADTIRQSGPHGGGVGSATASLANTLDSGGQYLQQGGLQAIGSDMTNLIRRNPLPAVLVGLGLGYILARATARS
jgi:hypothetical protein